jgi:hypothetical protein
MEVEEVEEALEDNQAAIEALMPSASSRKLRFRWPTGQLDAEQKEIFGDYTFVQSPLAMGPAQEFQTLMVKTLRETLQGEYGISIGELFGGGRQIQASMPTEITPDSVDELIGGENLKVIEAFLRLLEIVPDLMWEIIGMSLGVRRDKREAFKYKISGPAHENGATIDQTVDIVKVFVKQNGGPLRRFLEFQVREIGDEILEAISGQKKKDQSTPTTGGTQSNTTSPPIQEPV